MWARGVVTELTILQWFLVERAKTAHGVVSAIDVILERDFLQAGARESFHLLTS